MTKLLVVDDEKPFADSVRRWLEDEKYLVDLAFDGDSAKRCLSENRYDVVVLDVTLPHANGYEICREYRANGGLARVLFLTGKGTIADKQAGFQTGGDDYLTKPCDLNELSLRVKALLRRSLSMIGNEIVAGPLTIETSLRIARLEGREVKLLPQEHALVEYMALQPNKVFTNAELIKDVWHGQSSVDTVRTHVKNIRKKLRLSNGREMIRTIHGVGYCLDINEYW